MSLGPIWFTFPLCPPYSPLFRDLTHGVTHAVYGERNSVPVENRKWAAPMSGNQVRPPPVSAHVFTKFDSHRALCYGGRTKDGWTNATWIFDLDSKVSYIGSLGSHTHIPCPRLV